MYELSENAVLLGKPHDAVVALAHPADGAAHHVHLGSVARAARGRVHVRDHQLHRSVVLGMDEAVARRAVKTINT